MPKVTNQFFEICLGLIHSILNLTQNSILEKTFCNFFPNLLVNVTVFLLYFIKKGEQNFYYFLILTGKSFENSTYGFFWLFRLELLELSFAKKLILKCKKLCALTRASCAFVRCGRSTVLVTVERFT